MSLNGRRKGSSGELEVASLIKGWWGKYEPSALFIRTPLSGGWKYHAGAREHYNACGDLMTDSPNFPFCVEVKWRQQWSIDNFLDGRRCPPWEWWRQTITAAREQDGVPMMWLRKNRLRGSAKAFPWIVMIPLDYYLDQKLSEPDVQWDSLALTEREIDYDILPVAYDYRRFIEMSPTRMSLGKEVA